MGSQNVSPSFTVRANPEIPLGIEPGYVIDWDGGIAAFCLVKRVADEMAKMLNAHEDLVSALYSAMEFAEEGVPEKNCSCHIAPPCSDCVDYLGNRNVVDIAKEALRKAGA